MQTLTGYTMQNTLETFKQDVLTGLSASNKYLQAKYFYDTQGDYLFQKIMHCPEYYLTNCELEILSRQVNDILDICQKQIKEFDVVELGPGDAIKSIFLLEKLVQRQETLTYLPIDISNHIIQTLTKNISEKIKGTQVKGLPGEYLEMLAQIKEHHLPGRNKLVLFLGSSLGNMEFKEGITFLKKLRDMLYPGDLLLLGLDLAKAPEIILSAYNDKANITKEFNLNLLHRINRELNGNFNVERFSHFPIYDIQNNACKSYLISLMEQEVQIAGQSVSFLEKETIHMEISQKYDRNSIQKMLEQTGFALIHHFFDSKNWFVDTLWQAPFE